MAKAPTPKKIELEQNEYALIVGEEDGSFTIRIAGAEDPEEGEEMSEPAELVAALAQRLLNDPDFHDEVLEWWDEQEDEDEEKEKGEEE